MAATIVTRSDADKAIVKRTAVFVKELREGKHVYIREPYDIVEYDRSHQASGANKLETYCQPFGGRVRLNFSVEGQKALTGTDTNTTSREEVYDDLLVLDRPDPSSPHR